MDGDPLKTDVLVIGGGAAGCMAAIGAREAGAAVTLVDKACIKRSGDCGGGNVTFTTYLNEGEAWDTKEAFLRWYSDIAEGLVDIDVVNASTASQILLTVSRLEQMGIPLRDPNTGKYVRNRTFGAPGAYTVVFNGKNIKPALAEEVRKLGTTVCENVLTTDLLVRDNRVFGTLGIGTRDERIRIFSARVVILASGEVVRLYHNMTGNPFNSWHSPFNTGAAHAMAFRAGAQLANMEFTTCNLTPRGFSSAGYATLTGGGCHLVNGRGERFMDQYHEKGERGPRWAVTSAVYHELKEGRGPCFFDCRHLSSERIAHLLEEMHYDKETLLDFFHQKQLDLTKDLLEVQLSEPQLAGFTGKANGIVVNEDCETRVKGLYAAGDCSTPSYALSGALTTGYYAGKQAGRAALSLEGREDFSADTWDDIHRREKAICDIARRRHGPAWWTVEKKMRQIMTDFVGFERNEMGLRTAIEQLEKLAADAEALSAGNRHEWVRCLEATDLLAISKLVARGALERRESRFGTSHYRNDYPKPDQEHFRGSIILEREGNGIRASFQPAKSLPESIR